MNRKVKGFKRLALSSFGLLCMLATVICALSIPTFAAGKIDVDKTCSMTLSCSCNGEALSGFTFRLYRVADVSEAAVFTLSGDFSAYSVNLKNLDASGWLTAANTLATYIVPDGIHALKTQSTDSNGHIDFGSLPTGLYLIVGEPLTKADATYKAVPFLVCLPGQAGGDTWAYEVGVTAKISSETQPVFNESDITVLKVWNDGDDRDERPESIEVALMRDGSVYETYTLNEANYWRHTWNNLSYSYGWSVIETKVPEGYTVTYTSSGTILTVTNTETSPDEEPPTEDIPEEPVPEDPGGVLPQTGMLWWPVSVMAALGTVLFGLGWRERFRVRNNKSEK